MNSLKKIIVVVAFALMGFTSAQAAGGFSLSLGTDNFYVSVGNYDYLPYAYNVDPGYAPAPINFNNMMSDYGSWVYVPTFGQVWRPYVDASWRPYTYGHWIYTSYGPTWQGYEPWAWAGYHYGNWVWNERYGWVWIPGYDWHPGRVIWSRSYDTIGWMPAPPPGYDYSRGYLSYRGNVNQFTYDDPDFFNNGNGYYGGYNQGYNDLYNNPAYNNVAVNLWVFINNDHYGYNNYADYYLDRDYTRDVFARRAVRINSRPIQRAQLEQVTRTRINEVPVKVKELDTDRRRVKMVIPEGEEDNVRANANKTVRNVIAPAFAEKQRQFKGTNSANEKAVAKIFNQENKQPRVETVSTDTVINQAKEQNRKRDQERVRITRAQIDQVDKKEKENKNNRAQNNQEPGSAPGSSKVNEPAPEKPNQLPPEQNNNPYNKQPKTYQPNKEQPQEKPQDRDRDSQFDSSNKKNNKQMNEQPPATDVERVKKQAQEKIKKADQDQQNAQQKMKEADDSRRQAEEQLKRSQEVPGPDQEAMKKQAQDQMNQADQKKQEAQQDLNNAQDDKKQAVDQANKADDAKKKADQNKKKKDKDKDKDKPPSRSH